jgi:hypothetical protein
MIIAYSFQIVVQSIQNQATHVLSWKLRCFNRVACRCPAGDWHNINSRVKHFNRLLRPRGSDRRVITRSIVEQVIGRKLPS